MTNEELQGELVSCLEETRRTLALVVFLSMKNHPDQEVVDDLNRVLTRARTCIQLAEKEGFKK